MTGSTSAQMLRTSEQLGASIEGGEFDALSVEQRFELRRLALGIAAWADLVETMEAASAEPTRRLSNRRLAQAAGLVWGMNGAAVLVIGLILVLR